MSSAGKCRVDCNQQRGSKFRGMEKKKNAHFVAQTGLTLGCFVVLTHSGANFNSVIFSVEIERKGRLKKKGGEKQNVPGRQRGDVRRKVGRKTERRKDEERLRKNRKKRGELGGGGGRKGVT